MSETSESVFGLPEQPPNTCPMIDKAKKIIAKLSTRIKGYKKVDDVEELLDMLSDVEWDIDISSDLEDIRTNAENIRAWGQAWKDYAKSLQQEIAERNTRREEE